LNLLYSTLAVLLATGLYWEVAREPLLMKIHGAAAMLILVLIGRLLALHVPSGWTERRSRKSGAAMLAIGGLLTVTGYLLYYLGDETARQFASWFHLALGIAVPIALGLHLAAKPRQPAAHPAASQPPREPKELAQCKHPGGT
jgi:MFS family permease